MKSAPELKERESVCCGVAGACVPWCVCASYEPENQRPVSRIGEGRGEACMYTRSWLSATKARIIDSPAA